MVIRNNETIEKRDWGTSKKYFLVPTRKNLCDNFFSTTTMQEIALLSTKRFALSTLFILGSVIFAAAIFTISRATSNEENRSIDIKGNSSQHVDIDVAVIQANHSLLSQLSDENATSKGQSENGSLLVPNKSLLLERAERLRHEATDIRRLNSANSSQSKSINSKSRRIHLFTYASYGWNMTLQRFVLGAKRSEMYASIHPFFPNDLARIDPEFVKEFQEILALPRGGGYWLWKFPLLEYMLRMTPTNEYIFYIDSGSSILSSGNEVLDSWLNFLESSPSEKNEILRFHYAGGLRHEWKWCILDIFSAFHVSCFDSNPWEMCDTTQLPATGFIGLNGAALRETLALIYEALSQDPWMITDVYVRKSKRQWKRKRHQKFNDNRHDQCFLSLAAKILQNYVSLEVPDNHGLTVPRNRVFSFSRIKGEGGETVFQMDLESFAVWQKLCIPRIKNDDMFCDSLSLALHIDDSSSGLFASILNSWNTSRELIP
jgi:hypothetical protein